MVGYPASHCGQLALAGWAGAAAELPWSPHPVGWGDGGRAASWARKAGRVDKMLALVFSACCLPAPQAPTPAAASSVGLPFRRVVPPGRVSAHRAARESLEKVGEGAQDRVVWEGVRGVLCALLGLGRRRCAVTPHRLAACSFELLHPAFLRSCASRRPFHALPEPGASPLLERLVNLLHIRWTCCHAGDGRAPRRG